MDIEAANLLRPVLRITAALLAVAAVAGIVTEPRVAEIRVSKSRRTLQLVDAGGAVLREYAVIFGRGAGSKEREGDQRTPEGEYFVCVKNPRSRFHLSLGLSYPSAADATRARESGLISAEESEAIAAAERGRRRPPWDTPLGGEIFIHGDGEERDGTRGCIAVTNDDIEEIYRIVDLGTPVKIEG